MKSWNPFRKKTAVEQAPVVVPQPPPAPGRWLPGVHPKPKTTLTIGMAGYNEADCSWFTLMAARLMHQEVQENLHFVFVDNNPGGPHGEYIRNLVEHHIKNGRYIAMGGESGTAAPRDRVFKEATTDAVLCMDPHVLLPKGAVRKLLEYYDAHPDCMDLLQGPMLDDDLWGPDAEERFLASPKIHATHMRPVWRSEMFGIWSRIWLCKNCGQALDIIPTTEDDVPNRKVVFIDATTQQPLSSCGCGHEWPDINWGGHEGQLYANGFRELDLRDEPIEIPMHGLGLFSCRKEAWPGFNPAFRGFGGEEGYIHRKFAKRGNRTWCLPFLGWLHKFGRPEGVPYRLTVNDKCWNYLNGAKELDEPFEPIIEHFADKLPREEINNMLKVVKGESLVLPRLTNTPKVSCLMATHGRYKRVCQALTMFLMQDYENAELIILNNHPVPLRFDHPRVRIYNEPKYTTLGDCRNRLLELATGELVRTWDDDDWYLPWTLSQGVAWICGNLAWKPTRSWFTNGGSMFALKGNALEASILFRTEAVKRFGYKSAGGDEHSPLLDGLGDQIRHRELGVWASYTYTWGIGSFHISGSLGSDTVENRTAVWKKQNNDHGDGQPLQLVDLNHLWERMADYVDPELKEEWKARAFGWDPPMSSRQVPVDQQLTAIVNYAFPDRQNLVACEFGRIHRDGHADRAKYGWSTKQLAGHDKIREVHSIDPDPHTIATTRNVLTSQEWDKVKMAGHAVLDKMPAIDLLYLDASDDAMVNLQCFESVIPRLSNLAVIAINGAGDGRKPLLVRPRVEHCCRSFIVGDAMVMVQRPIPEAIRRIW